MAWVSDFKFGAQLGFAKAHYKITRRRRGEHGSRLGELPNICVFPFNIYTMLKLATSDLVHSLILPKPIIKITPVGKSSMALG